MGYIFTVVTDAIWRKANAMSEREQIARMKLREDRMNGAASKFFLPRDERGTTVTKRRPALWTYCRLLMGDFLTLRYHTGAAYSS